MSKVTYVVCDLCKLTINTDYPFEKNALSVNAKILDNHREFSGLHWRRERIHICKDCRQLIKKMRNEAERDKHEEV